MSISALVQMGEAYGPEIDGKFDFYLLLLLCHVAAI